MGKSHHVTLAGLKCCGILRHWTRVTGGLYLRWSCCGWTWPMLQFKARVDRCGQVIDCIGHMQSESNTAKRLLHLNLAWKVDASQL
jgi:hypothetical protein